MDSGMILPNTFGSSCILNERTNKSEENGSSKEGREKGKAAVRVGDVQFSSALSNAWLEYGSRVDPTRPLEDCHEVLPDPRFSRRRCRRCRVPFLSTHSSSRYAEPTLSCNKASKETFRFPANRRDSAIISNTRNTREFVSYKNFVHSVLCSCSWILEYTIISR